MSKKNKLTRRDLLAAGGRGAAIAGLAYALPGVNLAGAEEERTLRFAVADFGRNNLDPAIISDAVFVSAMFDPCFPLNVETGQLQPGVVDKWELSADGLVWTFRVRNDVVFHDGSKMTAADLVFTLERAQREDAWQFDLARATWGYPLKADMVDEYTVKITTPVPAPRSVANYNALTTPILFMLPKAYVEKVGYEEFARNPVGTGPYKFVSLVENDSLEFAAVDYPHWTGIVPDFKRAILTLVPEEATRIFMLEKGEIDGTHASVEAAIGAKAKGFSVLTGAQGMSQLNFIGEYLPEAKSSPLADVRVRKALSLALNRQEIVDTLLGGLGSLPTTQQALNLRGDDVAPWLADKWLPRMKDLWRYDPDEAKKLLAEAGYGGGFTADIWTAPDFSAPYLNDIVVAMAGYWSQVGFQANVVTVDSVAWRDSRRPPKSMKLVGKAGASATSLAKPVAIERLQYFTTDGGTLNLLVGSPDQAKMDQIYADGQKAIDLEEYTKLVDEGLELTTATYTCVSIVNAPVPVIVGPRVSAAVAPQSLYWSMYLNGWKYTGKEN